MSRFQSEATIMAFQSSTNSYQQEDNISQINYPQQWTHSISPLSTHFIGTFVTGDSVALADLNKSISTYDWRTTSNYTYNNASNGSNPQHSNLDEDDDFANISKRASFESDEEYTSFQSSFFDHYSFATDLPDNATPKQHRTKSDPSTLTSRPSSPSLSCSSKSVDTLDVVLSITDLQKYLRFVRLRPAMRPPIETANASSDKPNSTVRAATKVLLSFLMANVSYLPPLCLDADQSRSSDNPDFSRLSRVSSVASITDFSKSIDKNKRPYSLKKKLHLNHHKATRVGSNGSKNSDFRHHVDPDKPSSEVHNNHGKLSILKSKVLAPLHHGSSNVDLASLTSSPSSFNSVHSSSRNSVSSIKSSAEKKSHHRNSSLIDTNGHSSVALNTGYNNINPNDRYSSNIHPAGHKSLSATTSIIKPSSAAQLRNNSAPLPQVSNAPFSYNSSTSQGGPFVNTSRAQGLDACQSPKRSASSFATTAAHTTSLTTCQASTSSPSSTDSSLPTRPKFKKQSSISSIHSLNKLSNFLNKSKQNNLNTKSKNNKSNGIQSDSNIVPRRSDVSATNRYSLDPSLLARKLDNASTTQFQNIKDWSNGATETDFVDENSNFLTSRTISPTESIYHNLEEKKMEVPVAYTVDEELREKKGKKYDKVHSDASSSGSVKSSRSSKSVKKIKNFFDSKSKMSIEEGVISSPVMSRSSSSSVIEFPSKHQFFDKAALRHHKSQTSKQSRSSLQDKHCENVQKLRNQLQNFELPPAQVLKLVPGLTLQSNQAILRIQGQLVIETTGHESCKHYLEETKGKPSSHPSRTNREISTVPKSNSGPDDTRQKPPKPRNTSFSGHSDQTFNPYTTLGSISNYRVRHGSVVSQASRNSNRLTSALAPSPSSSSLQVYKPHGSSSLKLHTTQLFNDIVIDPQFPYSFVDIETIVTEAFAGSWHDFMETSFKIVAIPYTKLTKKCSDPEKGNDAENFEGTQSGVSSESECIEKEIGIEIRLIPNTDTDSPKPKSFGSCYTFPSKSVTESSGPADLATQQNNTTVLPRLPKIEAVQYVERSKPSKKSQGKGAKLKKEFKSKYHKQKRSLQKKIDETEDILLRSRMIDHAEEDHQSNAKSVDSPIAGSHAKDDIVEKEGSSYAGNRSTWYSDTFHGSKPANSELPDCGFEDIVKLRDISPYRCVLGQDWLAMLFAEFEEGFDETADETFVQPNEFDSKTDAGDEEGCYEEDDISSNANSVAFKNDFGFDKPKPVDSNDSDKSKQETGSGDNCKTVDDETKLPNTTDISGGPERNSSEIGPTDSAQVAVGLCQDPDRSVNVYSTPSHCEDSKAVCPFDCETDSPTLSSCETSLKR